MLGVSHLTVAELVQERKSGISITNQNGYIHKNLYGQEGTIFLIVR